MQIIKMHKNHLQKQLHIKNCSFIQSICIQIQSRIKAYCISKINKLHIHKYAETQKKSDIQTRWRTKLKKETDVYKKQIKYMLAAYWPVTGDFHSGRPPYLSRKRSMNCRRRSIRVGHKSWSIKSLRIYKEALGSATGSVAWNHRRTHRSMTWGRIRGRMDGR